MSKQEGIEELISEFLNDYDKQNGNPAIDWVLILRHRLANKGVVIKVESELPEKLTNNIGCMSKEQIEEFAGMVLRDCDYDFTMKWTTAGNIMIKPFIYLDERNIDQYPYLTKYWVLHEIAHIDTHPQDDRHGELFHRKLAELINRFMAGYVSVEPLIKEGE